MIALLFSELKGWYNKFSLRSIFISIISICIIESVTFLKPIFYFYVLILLSIWLGLLSAIQYWSEEKSWFWIKQAQIKIIQYLFGKILSILFIVIIHIFFILPALILMIIIFGISLQFIISIVLICLISSVTALGIGLLLNWNKFLSDGYFITLFIIAWFIITAVIPFLNQINPITQLNLFFLNGNIVQLFISLLINFGLILLIYFAAGVFIYIEKKRKAIFNI